MQREIFPYTDGERHRFADPFAVSTALSCFLEGNVKGYQESSVSPIAEIALPARERIKAAICAAFQMQPFDRDTGAGTTEDVLLAIFNAFLDWREKKNLSSGISPTLHPFLDSSPYSDASAAMRTAAPPMVSG